MRNIKFKGYSKCHEEWIYGEAYLDGHILNGVVESNEEYIIIEEWMPVVPSSVGQSIGLVDKCGRDIYEGDYVSVYDEYGDRNFTGVVVYKGGGFAIQNEHSTNYRLLDYEISIVDGLSNMESKVKEELEKALSCLVGCEHNSQSISKIFDVAKQVFVDL